MTSTAGRDAELAAELVVGAARVAAEWFRRPVEHWAKSNATDLVTAADHAAEQYVVTRLAAERPDDGVLGEEGARRDSASGRRWVIDPVDGTYNFFRGIDRWCSALALVDGDELVVGAVRDEARGETYVGGPLLGAAVDGVALPQSVDTPLAEACAATYLHPTYLHTPVGEAWTRVVSGLGTYRLLGSGTLEMASIARGHLDLFVHHSVPEWDRLPGEALLHAVGGTARHVEAGGVTWYVAGAPSAVAEACDRLVGG